MQKQQYLHVHRQKIAQQAWKIPQTCLRRLRVFPSMGRLAKNNGKPKKHKELLHKHIVNKEKQPPNKEK